MWKHKIIAYKYVLYSDVSCSSVCSVGCQPEKIEDCDCLRDTCPTCTFYKTESDQTSKGNGMNYSTAVFLINDDCRMIKCTYEPETKSVPKPTTYMFKTFDKSIMPGDYVVIPTDTRHGMTVVKVAEVDVDFDPETPTEIKWVIGKVDHGAYEKLLSQEQEMIITIQSAEKRKKKEALKEALFKDNEEKMKALQIAHTSEATKE